MSRMNKEREGWLITPAGASAEIKRKRLGDGGTGCIGDGGSNGIGDGGSVV